MNGEKVNNQKPRALVMAGGTGGHIFPALAIAQELENRGWHISWLGGPQSMEANLIPEKGIKFHTIDFSGVRGKGFKTLFLLPFKMLKAFAQSVKVIKTVRPDVVIGMGGYITFPAGVMASAMNKKLFIHEQNAVAGMVNKILSHLADGVFTAFDEVLINARNVKWVGNPVRVDFLEQLPPDERLKNRDILKELNLLIVGGSLGATALNKVVPAAIKIFQNKTNRTVNIIHQSGKKHIQELQEAYKQADLNPNISNISVMPFIEDMAKAYSNADIVICRAGASTVTEIAAVGAAALFVPFPHAVDDHQTANAEFLTKKGGGQCLQQDELTAEKLSSWLEEITNSQIKDWASQAYKLRKISAAKSVADECEKTLKK